MRTQPTMPPDEAINILRDAPRLVALGLAKGWIKPPAPLSAEDIEASDIRRDGPRDEEMVLWRRQHGLTQGQAAARIGCSRRHWLECETVRAKRNFTLP